MRTLIITLCLCTSLTAQQPQLGRIRSRDEVDRRLFDEYQARRTERRVYALQQRRAINSQRPPARGWLAIQVPVDPIGPSAIQRGWVWQPPIYGRRIIITPTLIDASY